MKNRYRIMTIILVLLLLGSLTACGAGPAASGDDHSDWAGVRDSITYGTLTDTGFYYVDVYRLSYFDFAANTSAVLCHKPGCLHEDNQCDAYLFGMSNRPMYFYNNRLYYVDSYEPTLYSRNAIGMELTKIATLGTKYLEEQKVVQIRSGAIAGGYLYYEASVSAVTVDENGDNTRMVERDYIGRVNLSTGKDEILIEEVYDNQYEKLILCAARENGVLLSRLEGMEDMDSKDSAFVETAAKSPVTLEYWNGETGETTVLFRKTRRECIGIAKLFNGKVYFKISGSMQSEDRGCTYSYDLNTGKEEKACPYYTNYQLCGSYTLCYDAENKEMLYDMATGKTLPCELDKSVYVYNVSNKGCVIGYSIYEEDGSRKERRFYYVTLDSLADGLQEADLQYIYTF